MTALSQPAEAAPRGESNLITIDYSKSLAERIAAGHYDWFNDDITPEQFPLTGEGVANFEVKLFHFDRSISSKDAVEAIESDGWKPAKIEHLLAFGSKYPEEQRKFPIIALGSSARVWGGCYAPYLGRHGSERSLNLDRWDGDCRDNDRFLAVRPTARIVSAAT